MLVSHRKKFIYLKTRKTAGTSVEVALEHYALPDDAKEREDSRTDMVESDVGIVGARTLGAKRCTYYNHMPARALRDLVPREVWDCYPKIVNLRNPWDKVVSKFHWVHRKAKMQNRAEIPALFFAWATTTDDFALDFDVYSIDGKVVADEFIHYDRLEQDYAGVCQKLGLTASVLPKLKAKARGSEKIPYVEYYNDETKRIVADLFAPEIEIFGWKFGENL